MGYKVRVGWILGSRNHAVVAAAALALWTGGSWSGQATWVGPNDSFWDLAGNWSPGIPGAADDAVLGAFDTEIRSGSFGIRSLIGTGRLTISGGVVSPSNASSVGALTMSGGTVSGAATLLVAGPSSWAGGVMAGTGSTVFNGALAVSGSDSHVINGRNVTLAGTTTWTNSGDFSGQFKIGNGSTLNNTGTLLDQNGSNTYIDQDFGGSASFVNAGSYIKTGAGDTIISVGYTNSGTVNVNAGVLTLYSNGSSSSGTYAVAEGATLRFGDGTHTLNSVSPLTGGGRVLVNNGVVSSPGALNIAGLLEVISGGLINNGTSTAASLRMSGGSIDGSGNLSVNGASIWTAGQIRGTTFNGPLTLTVGPGNSHVVRGNVDFRGVTTLTNVASPSGARMSLVGALRNSGLLLDQTASSTGFAMVFDGGSFTNTGTYTKSGAGTTLISAASVVNTGVINVNNGRLAFSSLFSVSNLGVTTGTLTGSAVLQTPLLNNNGRVRPGAPLGTLTVAGNYVQQSIGLLDIDLFDLGNTDRLSVEGSATLNGTLALSCFAECSFAVGDSVVIVESTGALSGAFASVTMTGFATGAFTVIYDNVASQVRLQVTEAVSAVPEPGTYALMIGGLLLLNRALRRHASSAS